MAIRRCPYCKAIIDESQKYCNNCGTQLLFPEDEEGPEEDIKGEKILDEDDASSSEEEEEEEVEEPVTEPEVEPEPEPEVEIEREEIDLEAALQRGAALPGEKAKEAELPAESGEEPESGGEAESVPESFPLGEGVIKTAEEVLQDLPDRDLVLEEEKEEAGEDEEEKVAANGLDFEAKGEIVRLMAEIEKRKSGLASEIPSSGRIESRSDDLPPWAELVKEKAAAAPAETEAEKDEIPAEKTNEDVLGSAGFIPGDTMDFQKEVLRRAERDSPQSSTMGIPESVTKGGEDLAPGRGVEAETGVETQEEVEEAAEEEAEMEEEAVEADESPAETAGPDLVPDRKLGFFGSVKAFLFDTLFVALIWFIAAALACRLMKVGLFALVREASLSLGLLFFALWGGYFFLFLFFLGETLGRRLAAAKD